MPSASMNAVAAAVRTIIILIVHARLQDSCAWSVYGQLSYSNIKTSLFQV